MSPPPPPPPPPPPFFPTFPHFFPSIRISIYLHCPPSVSFYPLVYIISLCSRLWAPLSGLRCSNSSSTGTQHSSTPLRRNNVQAPLKHSPTLHRHRHSWPTLGLFTGTVAQALRVGWSLRLRHCCTVGQLIRYYLL